MNELWKVLEEAFTRERGRDAVMEKGDVVVFQLNNCIVIKSLDGETNKTDIIIIGGKPVHIQVDYDCEWFEKNVRDEDTNISRSDDEEAL